jgi:FemAB-related protein (PEP-CTERM system-associated)
MSERTVDPRSSSSEKLGALLVRELDAANVERWDAFVMACPEATFFHRAGWAEVLRRAFGHDTHFLYAERNGVLCGVLPLGHIRSRLFGNTLISTPFCVLGGAVGDADACADLEKAAFELAHSLKVNVLELRHSQLRHPDWPAKRELYVNFRKTIDPDPEVNLKAIPRKQRAMVRKGIDAGLQGEIDQGIDRLFAAYSESVRNLGTPVFSRRYFATLKAVFGPDCEVLTVMHQGRTVASVMSFYFRDAVLPYYGGGTALARDLKGNDFLYWDLLRRACERGIRVFDYGRSKIGTGSYSFKKNWGFTPEPLHYEFQLVKAGRLPDVNPLNPKYRLFIEAWKRLPLPVSRWLGPLLARSLG